MSNKDIKNKELPVLPVRDIVMFPHMVVPVFVGREKSTAALEKAMAGDKKIMLVTQKDPEESNPATDKLYQTGTVCNILQIVPMKDGSLKVLLEGTERAAVTKFTEGADYLVAQTEAIAEDKPDMPAPQQEDLILTSIVEFEDYVQLHPGISNDVLARVEKIDNLSELADVISSHMIFSHITPIEQIKMRQMLLETDSPVARLTKISTLMSHESTILNTKKDIEEKVKKQMEEAQRKYYLSEELKAIRKELNNGKDPEDGIDELKKTIAETKLSEQAREKANKELERLRDMGPQSPEAAVVRNYIDWLISIPWNNPADLNYDDAKAQKILDDDHYGLEKPKDLILEHLAVLERAAKESGKSNILLVGPPGVGKTSLGKSVARATGREFIRMSLGGVRDESELRGHRRTYIGAMPGKIIQELKNVKTSNPLFLLDEVEKMGADHKSDPSSALLEILDPAQNHTFKDHYLDVDYDLSGIMFMCTANSLDMQQPILDRLEIIKLNGYTREQKFQIAKRHLVSKKMEEANFSKKEFSITDDALYDLIDYYTKEAGVRELERQISKLCRKTARKLKQDSTLSGVKITSKNLADKDYAGTRVFTHDIKSGEPTVGEVTGMAWTGTGGTTIDIEAVKWPEPGGQVVYTGNMGKVMAESIEVAEGLLKSRAGEGKLGLKMQDITGNKFKVHIPDGATPKDGPSAGAAIVTAIFSKALNLPVRKDVAMTGEVRLNGKILPIGGLTEKLGAALTAGITTAIIPEENKKDLAEVPNEITSAFTKIVTAVTIEDVLATALVDGENIVRGFQTEGVTPPKKEIGFLKERTTNSKNMTIQ